MKPDAIRDKIMSFAHTEFNKPECTNLEEIEKKIISKKDLFGRDFKFKILPTFCAKNARYTKHATAIQ